MTPKMTPKCLPFGSHLAPKMLQTASQRGVQKSIKKQLPKSSKIEPKWVEAFHSGAPKKSSKIEPWAKMVPQGGPKGVPSLKKPPKSCQQAPKSDKKQCKNADPNHHSTTQLSPKR